MKRLKDNIQLILIIIAVLGGAITFVLKTGGLLDAVHENTKRRLSSDLIVAQKEIKRLEEACSVACPAHDLEMLIRWRLHETATTKELNEIGVD